MQSSNKDLITYLHCKRNNKPAQQTITNLKTRSKQYLHSTKMIFYREIFIVATVSLLILIGPISDVYCLSMPSSSSSSRRDAIAAIATTATTSFLVWDTTVPMAFAAGTGTTTEGYKDGPEGLKYLVTREGTGPKPVRGQKIETSYTLWINSFPGDGPSAKQIDSSKKPLIGDQPVKVRAGVSQVIRGWDLALLDMMEGESRKLIVPPELGYGEKKMGPMPGKSTLYFEMTLTKVEPAEELSPDAKKWLEDHPL
jgi:FKBP-type peptidyl-prolyl cis-trans isomerase FkpA